MLDKKKFPLALVMIQPPAMPGSYLNDGQSFDSIIDTVLAEASMIAELGFDGFILQNMHDGPIAQHARTETIAFMSVLGNKLKEQFLDKVLGILINWDGIASLAVAEATKADFVRVEHLYTGVSIDLSGFMFGQCADILTFKKRIGSSTIKSAFADGLFMSGKDSEESLSLIKETRKTLPDVPIFLGGGATGENVFELLKYYDGVSVATWIKNGDMRNPIDPARAKQFLDGCKKAQQWREEHREDNL